MYHGLSVHYSSVVLFRAHCYILSTLSSLYIFFKITSRSVISREHMERLVDLVINIELKKIVNMPKIDSNHTLSTCYSEHIVSYFNVTLSRHSIVFIISSRTIIHTPVNHNMVKLTLLSLHFPSNTLIVVLF